MDAMKRLKKVNANEAETRTERKMPPVDTKPVADAQATYVNGRQVLKIAESNNANA
jgi:hypothetical protein